MQKAVEPENDAGFPKHNYSQLNCSCYSYPSKPGGASALALQSGLNPDWIASALYYRVPQKPTECVTRYVVIGSRGCIRKRSLI